jgi:hypothetical protein
MTVTVLGVILIASTRLHGITSQETAIFVMPFVDVFLVLFFLEDLYNHCLFLGVVEVCFHSKSLTALQRQKYHSGPLSIYKVLGQAEAGV